MNWQAHMRWVSVDKLCEGLLLIIAQNISVSAGIRSEFQFSVINTEEKQGKLIVLRYLFTTGSTLDNKQNIINELMF